MKKTYFLVLCVLILGYSLSAQRLAPHITTSGDKSVQSSLEMVKFDPNIYATTRLVQRISSDAFEAKTFSYDWHGTITAVKDSIGDEMVIDSITYDALNRVTRVDGYQLLPQGWTHVYYLEFTYDEDGNMIRRKNYNSLGTANFTQGGVYDYIYENGRLVRHNMYFGNYDLLGENCFYIYNAEGQCVEELSLTGIEDLDSSLKIINTYDDQGRISTKTTYYYGNYGWDLGPTDYFVYDEKGNCIDHSTKDQYGQYVDRHLYDYDLNVSANSVHMPYYIPELVFPEGYDDPNQRVLEHWYTLDDNHVLQYICDYEYVYSDEPLGVVQVETTTMRAFPNPTQGVVSLDLGEEIIEDVTVYDVCGRFMRMFQINARQSQLDISDFPSGIYFLKVQVDNGRIMLEKVMKQ